MAITPMMQQYLTIKEEHKDAILFFRLGDFYEMFFEDAVLASRELELTLTGRDCGLAERAPMCGVPYHALDTYLARLIQKGYKVAICEQLTDPDGKGPVERAVTRVVTPGTVIEQSMLEDREPSYILCLSIKGDRAGAAFCDLSTGEFWVYPIASIKNRLAEELSRLNPRELLVASEAQLMGISAQIDCPVTEGDPASFVYKNALGALREHFASIEMDAAGLQGEKLLVEAAGALMRYLLGTQKNALGHILTIKRFESARYMTIDRAAAMSLELVEAGRTRTRKGSLLWTLDKTVTAMGGRMLRSWIERPLLDKVEIEARLDAVAHLKGNAIGVESLREQLRGVYDVERLLSRIAYDSVNPRECLSLARSLSAVPYVKDLLRGMDADALGAVDAMLDPMDALVALLDRAISPDAPVSAKEGGIFQVGYDETLDRLRSAATDGKTWIAQLEQQERDETGIKNLKIGFNRVFGYYIEVTKSFYDLVPYRYVRKQTLAGCERFVTQELKEIEKTVLGADDQAMRLEYELFSDIRARLKEALPRLQATAQGLKTLDALLSLSQVALENDYVRPDIHEDGPIEIEDGRHPVVEQAIGRERFVPNDTHITHESWLMIITGPNMAGKSTYMRQVALIALMAQVGSFVPARSARLPIVDRIFTRIGASDDLYGGQSTFMVEMTEMANILKHMTDRSLLVLDEVGRGTSTFDGLSIAWAAVEHIALKRAKTLFATHYHELSELEGRLDGVANYRITAREQGEDVIFLRKIVPGGADRSFGVAVASLAGLPASLIARARQIMARLEVEGELGGSIGRSILDKRKNAGDRQIRLSDYGATELAEEMKKVDVMALTPVDALNLLYTLVEKARRV